MQSLNDEQLLALNILQEAGQELPAGKAAIARVVKNRMAHKFFSDGTVTGTVLAKDQFSWAWFVFTNGEYARVCETEEDAATRASALFLQYPSSLMQRMTLLAQSVMNGEYKDPLYDLLTDDAVLYYNLAITKKTPEWATEDKLVCIIGRHHFFKT